MMKHDGARRWSVRMLTAGTVCVSLAAFACAQDATEPTSESMRVVAEPSTYADRASTPEGSRVPVRWVEREPIRVGLTDLPEPFHTSSARKGPRIAPPPESAALDVPPGFVVNVFADNVPRARWLALTPEGDVLCASSRTNTIHLLRDTNSDGVADERHVFLDQSRGANLPFGMAFSDSHFYLGNTDAVWRYPYTSGLRRLGAEREKVTDLPGQGYNQHWTRNVRIAPDGKRLFVTVGSRSNVSVEEPPRAAVLVMNLDGSGRKVFADGLRNPVGFDFQPRTGEPYTTVNERDGLGDDLVPDYLTRIREGEFYGWPYAYLTPANIDPRRTSDGQSERPDLVAKTRTPDVLFKSHSAALGLAFYRGDAFPPAYRNGAYVAFRGSWNRSAGTGYKIVFVPFDDAGRPRGDYLDFVSGFLIEPSVPLTWGRPVGVLAAPDGSLLFTEEAHGRIYRVQYIGAEPTAATSDAEAGSDSAAGE